MTDSNAVTADETSSPSAEGALTVLAEHARTAAPHELADLVDICAQALGVEGAVAYLADLQQRVLVPFLGQAGAGQETAPLSLGIDATLAGRAFQTFEVQIQGSGRGPARLWFPLIAGTDRIGVLAIAVSDVAVLAADGDRLTGLLARLASTTAELVAAKTLDGDTLVRLRRTSRWA